MTLYQIFFLFLKLNNVSCEVRSLYKHNPKLDFSDYRKNQNMLFIKKLNFKDFFDKAITGYNYGYDKFYYIFDEFMESSQRKTCSKQLSMTIKKWRYFIKNNIKLYLKKGDVVTFRYNQSGEDIGTFKSIVKGNIVKVGLQNDKGDIEIPIDMIKTVNDRSPKFYVIRYRHVYGLR